jgi:hypothetical protein
LAVRCARMVEPSGLGSRERLYVVPWWPVEPRACASLTASPSYSRPPTISGAVNSGVPHCALSAPPAAGAVTAAMPKSAIWKERGGGESVAGRLRGWRSQRVHYCCMRARRPPSAHLDVAGVVHQDVLWLEVAVHDAPGKGQGEGGCWVVQRSDRTQWRSLSCCWLRVRPAFGLRAGGTRAKAGRALPPTACGSTPAPT